MYIIDANTINIDLIAPKEEERSQIITFAIKDTIVQNKQTKIGETRVNTW